MTKEPRSAYDKWNISVVTNKVMDWYKQTTIFCLASFKVSVFDLSCVEAFFFTSGPLSFGVRYSCLLMSILRSCWILNSMLSLADFLRSSRFSHFKDFTIFVTQRGVRSV